VLNSKSIVIIRIKEEHLLYSNISGGIIGYGRKVYYVEKKLYSKRSPMGEGLLYSKSSGGLIYYGGRFTL
jgi:hypothetical protein